MSTNSQQSLRETRSATDVEVTSSPSRWNKLVIGGSVVILLGVVIGVAVGVPLSMKSENEKTIEELLKEVPLIDGYVSVMRIRYLINI